MLHDRNLRGRGSVRCRRLAGVALAAMVATGLSTGVRVAGAAEPIPPTPQVDAAIERVADPVPDQYVVVLKDPGPDAPVSAQATAIADEYGLDVVLAGLEEMLHAPWGGERFRPSLLLKTKVRAGHLGKKSGRGFHEHMAW